MKHLWSTKFNNLQVLCSKKSMIYKIQSLFRITLFQNTVVFPCVCVQKHVNKFSKFSGFPYGNYKVYNIL